MESYCLIDIELHICKIKKFWRFVSQQCEYTKISEMYTQKMVKIVTCIKKEAL